MKYVIGTRGSKLALWQANFVCDTLKEHYPEHEFELRIIVTKGDVIKDRPISQIADKGLFVSEIENMILSDEVQIGVHSMKDMALPADGLIYTKPWKREDPRDALCLREKHSLEELPFGATIATGSIRREVQLRKLRPDLNIIDIRGNVDTRLRKMDEQKLDGIVLAAAGLHRLGLSHRITQYFEMDQMIPSPAQGTLAIEVREDATLLREMIDALSDEETNEITKAERGFLEEMGCDCHTPIGAVCTKREDGQYELRAMCGEKTGKKLAYARVVGEDTVQLARLAARQIRSELSGTVYLIGGGPGDPSLITVKGLQILQKADCIIYDRLISNALLKEAKKDCELIYVGKVNHDHTMKQEDINQLLVQKSLQYKTVVRLKGGDVYVFGRGGEEGIALHESGVPFEIIPGVSSCTAGLAYAGIPITYRGIAGGFFVVSAHNQKDELAEIDFEAMASGKYTCVFLMGLSKLSEIINNLLQSGMKEATPVAVISHATLPQQKTCVADLLHIVEVVKKERLCSPSIIVVGEVVKFRDSLNFYEVADKLLDKSSDKLSDKSSDKASNKLTEKAHGKYLMPKIGEETTKLTKMLRECGKVIDEIQVGRIEYKKVWLTKEKLSQIDWLVFTSQHGVEAFFTNLKETNLDTRSIGSCKVAAIGEKTEKCLAMHGVVADLVPGEFNSAALQNELQKYIKPTDVVWYLKAQNADEHLKEALCEYCSFEEVVVYENVEIGCDREKGLVEDKSGLCGKIENETGVCWINRKTEIFGNEYTGDERVEYDYFGQEIQEYEGIIFTCESNVNRLLQKYTKEELMKLLQKTKVYSIGPKTSKCLHDYGFKQVIEAKASTYEALVERVCEDKKKEGKILETLVGVRR